jgi:hypothetical protein
MEERGWPEWRNGKPITPTQLAAMLRPFGIRPTAIRTCHNYIAKGYLKEAFNEVWQRYLPPEDTPPAQEGGSEPLQRYNPQNSAVSAESAPVTRRSDVTDQIARKAAEKLECNGVTPCDPPSRGDRVSPPARRAVL